MGVRWVRVTAAATSAESASLGETKPKDAATDAKECAKVLFHIQAKAFES